MTAVDRTENALMPSGPYRYCPLGETFGPEAAKKCDHIWLNKLYCEGFLVVS